MKEMNLIDDGAYSGSIKFTACDFVACYDDPACPAGCCREKSGKRARLRVGEFFRYPKTGAEYNKGKTGLKSEGGNGWERFPSQEPVKMPKPTVEQVMPSYPGDGGEKWMEWKRKNGVDFEYPVGTDTIGGCMRPDAFRSKYSTTWKLSP